MYMSCSFQQKLAKPSFDANTKLLYASDYINIKKNRIIKNDNNYITLNNKLYIKNLLDVDVLQYNPNPSTYISPTNIIPSLNFIQNYTIFPNVRK